MKIQLSDHFYLPAAASIYAALHHHDDLYLYLWRGRRLFVSNYVGKTPFAAVNFIMPFLMILGGVGFMFGTGGSALISKTLGEGDPQRANRIFSLLIYLSVFSGLLLTLLGFLLLRPIAGGNGRFGRNAGALPFLWPDHSAGHPGLHAAI